MSWLTNDWFLVGGGWRLLLSCVFELPVPNHLPSAKARKLILTCTLTCFEYNIYWFPILSFCGMMSNKTIREKVEERRKEGPSFSLNQQPQVQKEQGTVEKQGLRRGAMGALKNQGIVVAC